MCTGKEGCEKSLSLPLNFYVNPKLLLESEVSIKKVIMKLTVIKKYENLCNKWPSLSSQHIFFFVLDITICDHPSLCLCLHIEQQKGLTSLR